MRRFLSSLLGLDALTRFAPDGVPGGSAGDDGNTPPPPAGDGGNADDDPAKGLDDLLKDPAKAKEHILKLRKEAADRRVKGKTSETELEALRKEKAEREAQKKKEDEDAMKKRGEHEKIIAERDTTIQTLTTELASVKKQLETYAVRDKGELDETMKALTKDEIELINTIDENDIPKRLKLASMLKAKKGTGPTAPDTPPSGGFGAANGTQSTEDFIKNAMKS